MSDQSGDVSGTGGFTPNAPDPTLTPGGSPGAAPSFGAPASSFSAPPAGGGGAVSAPGGGAAPAASPAGFGGDGNVSLVGPGQPNVSDNAPTVASSGGGAASSGAGGGAAGGAGTGSNSVLNAIRNPSTDSILNAVGGNLGPLASLGILGFEAANRPGGIGGGQLPAGAQPGPTAASLVNTAGTLQTAGQALSQPLATGRLPPGAQAAVDEVTQQQEAQIRQQFASMGLSGSSMEASAIAQAQQAAQTRGFQLAQQMAQQGLSDLNLSSNIFGELLNAGLQQDQQFQDALTKFAESMAGGGGTTIRVGQ